MRSWPARSHLESPPLGVAKKRLKVARAPIFRLMIVETFEFLERRLSGGEGRVGHADNPLSVMPDSAADRVAVNHERNITGPS